MVVVILLALVVKAIATLTIAVELNWFAGPAGEVCAALKPDCNELVSLVDRFYVWLPVLIVGAVVLLTLHRLDRRRRADVSILVIAASLGIAATYLLWRVPRDSDSSAWFRGEPGWALGLLVLALVLIGGREVWVSDDGAAASERAHPGLTLVRHRLGQHRVAILVMAAYALLFLVADQSSGQALDALRSWGLRGQPQGTTAALGLISALLLSLTIRETGREFERQRSKERGDFVTWWWITAGVVVTVVGVILNYSTPMGSGVLLLGGALLSMGVIGVFPAPSRPRKEPPELDSPMSSGDDPRPRLSIVGQWIVALPFLVIATGLANVAVDRYWVTGHVGGHYVLILAALFLGALVSVDEYGYRPHEDWSAVTSVIVWTIPAILVAVPFATLEVRNVTLTLAVSAGLGIVTLSYAYAVIRGNSIGSLQLSLPVTMWASVAAAVSVHIDPIKTGEVFGTVTLVNLAAGILVVLGYGVVRAAAKYRPPDFLEWLGYRSLPVLTMLLAWWIVCGTALPEEMHDVEVVQRKAPETWSAEQQRTPDLKDAFDAWVRAQPELADQPKSTAGERPPGNPDPPVPMMLVATHGGGIRAAYWTALVLDCLVARSRSIDERVCHGPRRDQPGTEAAARRIFVASGVSGGSVGLASYAQHMLYGDLENDEWIRDKLGSDFAAPTVAWGLFHDLPNHALGVTAARGRCEGWRPFQCVRRDRAGILEDTLDKDSPEQGPAQLRKTWDERMSDDSLTRKKAETVPLLVFNSTQVGGKFSVVTSAAKFGSQKLDLDASSGVRPVRNDEPLPLGGALETVDLLCSDSDLKLSTAAMLSARFPLVSPSGRLSGKCGQSPAGQRFKYKDCVSKRCAIYMVDGGYFDNSGLLTLAGLSGQLRRLVAAYNATHLRKIAPFVVDIDSSYQARDPKFTDPGQIAESTAPLQTWGVSGAVERWARGRIYAMFPRRCAVTIAPAVQPALMAPLGWSLSETTMGELEMALDAEGRDGDGKALGRRENLRMVQGWLGDESPEGQVSEDLLNGCAGIAPTRR